MSEDREMSYDQEVIHDAIVYMFRSGKSFTAIQSKLHISYMQVIDAIREELIRLDEIRAKLEEDEDNA